MEQTKTNIPGFDELIGGGLPRGRVILLSGTPGTGKTIFALQYLYNGAILLKEKGLYVTFEENLQNLTEQASLFGWDIEKLRKQGKIKILDIEPQKVKEDTAQRILSIINKGNYKRLVIDSLSALAINTPNSFGSTMDITELAIKRFLYHFINNLHKSNATSVLISQTKDDQLSGDGVSEFLCDGVVQIRHQSLGGSFSRHLLIKKMRGVKNNEEAHPLEISNKGITIHHLE